MEEDIKILRKLLNEKFNEEMIHALDTLGKDVNETYVLTLPEREAIENILNRLEQLEKENNILKNHIKYKSCTVCGKEYETKRSDSKYCSECAKKSNSRWFANATEEYKAKRREQVKLNMRKYRARKKCE